jgi:hypothetical protein
MRILIWSQVPLSRTSGYWFWLKNGMEAAGHQVIALDMLALASIYGPIGMQRIILHYARAYAVDVTLITPGNCVEPALLAALRRLGSVVVGLRYDDAVYVAPGLTIPAPGHLKYLTNLDDACDLVVTICRRAETLFADLGLTAPTYLPLAFPWQLVAAEPLPLAPVVRFSGSARYRADQPDSWRVRVARAVFAAGLPLELCHDTWAAVPGLQAAARPTPPLQDYFTDLRTATVNICLSGDYLPDPVPGMRLLHLEVAASGGMQITNPSEELADYFTAGTDIAYAETPEAVVRQARHYLDRPDEARRMGQNSRKALVAKGGWELWWANVAGLLSERGIALDLASAHRPPAPELVPTLSLVATSLAHAHETAGNLASAAVYFDEVLAYDPNDYAGLAGRARLAADSESAYPYWLRAFQSVTPTQSVVTPAHFGSKAFVNTTNFALEAAVESIRLALDLARYDDIIAILADLPATGSELAYGLAKQLLTLKQIPHCMQALHLAISQWPDDPRPLRLRGTLHLQQGRFVEGNADHAQAAILERMPPRRA